MSATLEIVAAGAMATIQDLGRNGWRRDGVPRAGALDPGGLRIANVLAGNAEGAPAIEFFVAGPTLKAIDAPLQLGLAGDFASIVLRADGTRQQLDAWRSVTLAPGDTLRAGTPRQGRGGTIAVGGLQVEAVLGSAATYARAQLGGHRGRALAAGDRLVVQPLPPSADGALVQRLLRKPPAAERGPIRVVPGPQADHFDDDVLQAFFAAEYRVSADADRMGVRLSGPALRHNARGSEIVTDATVPGSIQVPGNGLPIVLLADGQTAGGYPKIATVISADLPRLAMAAIGTALRFEPVSVAQAEALARQREADLCRLLATIRPLALDGDIDLEAIFAANLVSGMIDALATDPE